MGIVKGDAYGHGIVQVAHKLMASGADSLGVAICEEGMALREAGISAPTLVMGFTPGPLLNEVVQNNLIQTVFNPTGAVALSTAAKQAGKRVQVHIKIDTGMSRLGFLPKPESIDAICEITRDPQLDIQGIYTHCATSDALENGFVYEQQARFEWVLGELEKRGLHIPVKHMANSGAVMQKFLTSVRFEQKLFLDAVRVGILLYGLPPSLEMAELCKPLGLKPAMRLLSQVSMVKELAAGVGISYGHIFTTTRPTTIAVIPVGYADGYPRRLTHGGKVIIKGKFAPILGAICMDQCMVDVTDIPGVEPGDTVTLLGEDLVNERVDVNRVASSGAAALAERPHPGSAETYISADDLAEIVGTISYEIICGIGKRVPRVYINGN
jgi:alanine racemase